MYVFKMKLLDFSAVPPDFLLVLQQALLTEKNFPWLSFPVSLYRNMHLVVISVPKEIPLISLFKIFLY